MIRFYGEGEIQRFLGEVELSEDVILKATVSALNKVVVSTRAFAAKKISEQYNITQKAVRADLNISKANASTLFASISGSGSPGIPLYQFTPTPKRVPSTKRTSSGGYTPLIGIKAMIRRAQRKVVKGAFIARMHSGHIGVFKRLENGSIKELYGPSALRMLDSDYFYEALDNFTEEVMDKNMAHEAAFYLQRKGTL